ncbi:hypothetical protein [Nocardia sp. X0981]
MWVLVIKLSPVSGNNHASSAGVGTTAIVAAEVEQEATARRAARRT